MAEVTESISEHIICFSDTESAVLGELEAISPGAFATRWKGQDGERVGMANTRYVSSTNIR